MNPFSRLYRIADGLRYLKHADIGRHGEDLAHRWLRAKGFRVVARNWRPPQGGGEVDIIAWEGDCLVFIEVKTRATDLWAAPERDVDHEKMQALRRAARDYIRRANADATRVRFDAISITARRIEHLRDAFAATEAPR